MKTITAALAAGILFLGCGEGTWRSTPLPPDTSTRTVEAPLECASLPGTDVELAATPRLDAESEWLAIAVDEAFVATPLTYERIRGDLAAIRERLPEAERIHVQTRDSRLSLEVDEATHAAIASGTYHAWDCLHARYGWQEPTLDAFETTHHYYASGRLLARVDPKAVAALYNELPGVSMASFGSPTDGSRLCATRDPDERMHYVFVEGLGDCESGCMGRTYTHVTTAPDGLIELAGVTSTSDPTVPAWVTQYADRLSGRCL